MLRVVVQSGAEGTIPIALEIYVAEFAVSDEDVRKAVAIEVAHQRRMPWVAADRVAHGRHSDRAVAVSEQNRNVGAVSVGNHDIGLAISVHVGDGGGSGLNIGVAASRCCGRSVVDACLEGAVAVIDVDGQVLVAAVRADNFSPAVAGEVASGQIAGVIDGVGSEQAGARLGERESAGGLQINVNLLGGVVQASKINLAVAIEVGENEAVGGEGGQSGGGSVLERAIAVAEKVPDLAGI